MSVCAHGLVFAAITHIRNGREAATLPEENDGVTLTLVAASMAAPTTPTEPEAVKAEPAVAIPPSVPPVIESITQPPEPIAVKPPETIITPEPPPQRVIVPEVTPVVPSTAPAPPVVSRPVRIEIAKPGDGSSAEPGADATTIRATIGTRAHPAYRKNPEPAYPLSARRRGQEGTVLLSVRVSADGRAMRVAIKQSSGFSVLDEAARQAVKSWEFEAARVNSMHIESDIEVPVRFRLSE